MATREGPLSGERWNDIARGIEEMFWERVAFFEELLTEGGYPPFSDPLPEIEQYQRLVSWYVAGDPRFWENPEADAALAELERKFGPRPRLSPYTQPQVI